MLGGRVVDDERRRRLRRAVAFSKGVLEGTVDSRDCRSGSAAIISQKWISFDTYWTYDVTVAVTTDNAGVTMVVEVAVAAVNTVVVVDTCIYAEQNEDAPLVYLVK